MAQVLGRPSGSGQVPDEGLVPVSFLWCCHGLSPSVSKTPLTVSDTTAFRAEVLQVLTAQQGDSAAQHMVTATSHEVAGLRTADATLRRARCRSRTMFLMDEPPIHATDDDAG